MKATLFNHIKIRVTNVSVMRNTVSVMESVPEGLVEPLTIACEKVNGVPYTIVLNSGS